MCCQAKTQDPFDVASVEACLQLFSRRNPELLVNAENAFGIEPRIPADVRKLRARVRAQLFQLVQRASQDDFTDAGGDGLADAGKGGQVGLLTHKLVDAVGKRPQSRGSALIGLDLVGILFLGRS